MSDERERKYAEALTGSVFDPSLEAGWQHRLPTARERALRAMAVADAEQAELEQALAEQGLANFALKAQMEATQEENQRLRGEVLGWEDWSNDLATLLPEDAETWPGANPEGAQESIIEACLKHLVDQVARVEALIERLEGNGGVASPKALRRTLDDLPIYG